MRIRAAQRGGHFWGCPRYPNCTGTRRPHERANDAPAPAPAPAPVPAQAATHKAPPGVAVPAPGMAQPKPPPAAAVPPRGLAAPAGPPAVPKGAPPVYQPEQEPVPRRWPAQPMQPPPPKGAAPANPAQVPPPPEGPAPPPHGREIPPGWQIHFDLPGPEPRFGQVPCRYSCGQSFGSTTQERGHVGHCLYNARCRYYTANPSALPINARCRLDAADHGTAGRRR